MELVLSFADTTTWSIGSVWSSGAVILTPSSGTPPGLVEAVFINVYLCSAGKDPSYGTVYN